jgi:hypothetical protein
MKKSNFLKIFLIVSLIILTWLIFSKHLKKNNVILSKPENTLLSSEDGFLYNSNIIKDINYTSKDLKGNEYIIIAKEGEIDLDNSDIIFLTDVTAYVKLVKNSELIVVSSDYGKYNTINYDTIFSKNVKIEYVDNIITGDYLDFSMIKNLLIISRNVVYKNLENILMADVVELNTITKDTKIYMFDSNHKVKVKNY